MLRVHFKSDTGSALARIAFVSPPGFYPHARWNILRARVERHPGVRVRVAVVAGQVSCRASVPRGCALRGGRKGVAKGAASISVRIVGTPDVGCVACRLTALNVRRHAVARRVFKASPGSEGMGS
jgi:hypothetical protein